ncbi:predicted protein [Arabidopsis lyrata subsp. lyrata]|uniref:Predicted protein n=1 Tax=Arabidopsis lyrata subsp. lyrata TaxID=81972 RepID=D7L164_ARALL|nr:predicted protein [Arabidopsis lyrata subsp. lyrata]
MPPRNVGSLVVAQYHRRRCGSRYFSGKPPHKPIKDMKEEFQGVVDSRSRQAVDGMAKRFPKLFEISSRALTFIYGGRELTVNKENNHIEVEKLKREVTVNKENNQREVEKLTTEVRLNKEDKEREVEKINLQLHSFRQFLSNHVLIPIHQRNPVTAKVEENLQLSRLQDYMARLRREDNSKPSTGSLRPVKSQNAIGHSKAFAVYHYWMFFWMLLTKKPAFS